MTINASVTGLNIQYFFYSGGKLGDEIKSSLAESISSSKSVKKIKCEARHSCSNEITWTISWIWIFRWVDCSVKKESKGTKRRIWVFLTSLSRISWLEIKVCVSTAELNKVYQTISALWFNMIPFSCHKDFRRKFQLLQKLNVNLMLLPDWADTNKNEDGFEHVLMVPACQLLLVTLVWGDEGLAHLGWPGERGWQRRCVGGASTGPGCRRNISMSSGSVSTHNYSKNVSYKYACNPPPPYMTIVRQNALMSLRFR